MNKKSEKEKTKKPEGKKNQTGKKTRQAKKPDRQNVSNFLFSLPDSVLL